jgi:lactoylglutathione lyase
MMRVSFVNIPVSDQDRALKFYTEKLGFEVITDKAYGPDQRWIQLLPPGAETGIVLFTPPGQDDRIGTFQNMAFICEDVEGTCKTLQERGVEFVEPAKRSDWGGMQAIFKDPDGNVFVLANPNE